MRLTSYRQLYLGCRWCPLVALITQFLVLDVTEGTGCQVPTLLALARSGWARATKLLYS